MDPDPSRRKSAPLLNIYFISFQFIPTWSRRMLLA